jgi:hypothetical protein
MNIQIGARVRSFDFIFNKSGRDLEGPEACFVEGEVVAFDYAEGCKRYCILVDRDVFGGKEEEHRIGRLVTPPINGTPCFDQGFTEFVLAL